MIVGPNWIELCNLLVLFCWIGCALGTAGVWCDECCLRESVASRLQSRYTPQSSLCYRTLIFLSKDLSSTSCGSLPLFVYSCLSQNGELVHVQGAE